MTIPALVLMAYRIMEYSPEQMASGYYYEMYIFLLAVFVSFTNQVSIFCPSRLHLLVIQTLRKVASEAWTVGFCMLSIGCYIQLYTGSSHTFCLYLFCHGFPTVHLQYCKINIFVVSNSHSGSWHKNVVTVCPCHSSLVCCVFVCFALKMKPNCLLIHWWYNSISTIQNVIALVGLMCINFLGIPY